MLLYLIEKEGKGMQSKTKPGDTFYKLTAQWLFKSKTENIWKCTCTCGGYCYVKENALEQDIVKECGKCKENKRNKIDDGNYIGPMWLRRPETMQPESGVESY